MGQSDLGEIEPIATGDLAQTPFAHLLLYLHRQAQGGTLVVNDPRGGVSRVLFNNGNPFMAQLAWEAEDTLHGLLPLCGLAGGAYAFYAEELVPLPTVVGEADPFEIIGASIERYVHEAVIAPVVEQYLGVRLRIQRGKRLTRLQLPRSDAPLLDLIRAEPINGESILAQSPLTPERTRRVLYALLVTHALAPFDTEQLQEAKRRLDSPQRSQNSLAPAARVVHRSKHASFVNAVPVASPTRSVAGVPAPTSHRPPTDNAGGMDVENTIKLAEHMLRNRNHEEALFPLERVARHHPDRADVCALRAYIMYDRDARGRGQMPEHIAKLIEQALELNPEEPRAMFLRAMELNGRGEDAKAARYLTSVIEADPHNIEAKRELHLIRKRAG